jgi:hypothetical protein
MPPAATCRSLQHESRPADFFDGNMFDSTLRWVPCPASPSCRIGAKAAMAVMAQRRAWAAQPWRQPDPNDLSVGVEAWEDAVVANAVTFRLIQVNRHGFSCVDVHTFDDAVAFLAESKDRDKILCYAVTAEGREVCITGPRFQHFGAVYALWHRPGGRA